MEPLHPSVVLRYLWAAPVTLLGLLFVPLALLSGGSVRVCEGIAEIAGGLLRWLPGPFVAMTLGHAVLARDARALDGCRAHEQAHVRQYERWGPLFIPLYLCSSALVWLRGGRPYLDNHFERQARAEAARR